MISPRTLTRPASKSWRCWRCSFSTSRASYSVDTGAPPLLAKLRTDMKEALKAKDKTRLNVLRGILTETTSLEKESKGIKTNKQLYKLLQKRKSASLNAAKEFQAANREDLTGKENEQIGILQGYLNGFDTMTADEIIGAIQATIQEFETEGVTPKRDKVRARLSRGAFEDKILDEALVAKTINRMVHEVAPSKPSAAQM
ncbi:MAG: hypothetical protein L6R38_004366 [Xanthoria sp. 2 TBL-2021]|nr:MAG: hypothetical protein L6R38_004366 [Xanthoria sp. 2 TBL-2021]